MVYFLSYMLCEFGSAIMIRMQHDKDAVDALRTDYEDKIKGPTYLHERNRLDVLLAQDVNDIREHRKSCSVCGVMK